MIRNRPLTENFSLYEMLTSETAARKGFTEQHSPSRTVVKNLQLLCTNILQPLRDALKYPLHVTSGYRCPRLNTAIGGAKSSQHLFGQAADIEDFKNGNEYLLRKIVELQLPFDQMINEFGYQWVHVSFAARRPRKQILEAVREKNKTVYRPIVLV